MKILIVYHSYYNNNTKKVALTFNEIANGKLINLNRDKDCNLNLDDYEIIGLGSGVYKESLSPTIFKLINKLDFTNKNVFVFSTSGVGLRFYNKSLIKALKARGAKVRGDFACKGSFVAKDFSDNRIFDIIGRLSMGHPNDKDLKKAKKFMRKLLESL